MNSLISFGYPLEGYESLIGVSFPVNVYEKRYSVVLRSPSFGVELVPLTFVGRSNWPWQAKRHIRRNRRRG